MTERILGPTDSRRRRRFLLAPILLVALAALFLVAGAQAVHDTGAFELDGNATNDPAVAGDDWDNVCHEVTGSDCSTTNDTSGATAVSWVSELNRNSTLFTGGHSKDPDDVTAWNWKDGAGGLPDKDNLQHSFAARYSLTPGPTCPVVGSQTTCEVLFFGSDRFDNSGDAQEGFWFLQNPTCLAGIPQQDGSPCPNTNPGKFVDPDTGAPAAHAVGDILILSDFSNGGDVSTINVYEWVGTGGDTNGTLQSLGGGVNRSCGAALAGDGFCGAVNPGPGLTDAPWPFLDKSGNTDYLNGEFFEGGLNLSALSAAAASECFATFLSETRAATSATATLKDFVLGQFAPCVATMTTTPSDTSVIPGEAVHDTATVVGSSAAHTPSGDVEFFLCSFAINSTEVCDGMVNVGTSIGSGTLSGSGDTATAVSPDVNTAANPLTPGHYCFRAHWPGDDNYQQALDFDGAAECFDVAKLPSATVTTPNDGSGTPLSTITLGSSIFDTAVVTGEQAGGDPTGNVNFFLCGPIAAPATCTSDGTADPGNPHGLVSDGNPNTFTSSTTSSAFTPSAVGRYCFRANYLGSNIYNESKDDTGGECFTVTTTSAATSAQTWLPNDSATISSAGNNTNLDGTLSFTLYDSADCTGTILRPAQTFTFTNLSSPQTRTTTNTSVTVSGDGAHTVSWKVEFTSTNPFVGSSNKCETTSLTITN